MPKKILFWLKKSLTGQPLTVYFCIKGAKRRKKKFTAKESVNSTALNSSVSGVNGLSNL